MAAPSWELRRSTLGPHLCAAACLLLVVCYQPQVLLHLLVALLQQLLQRSVFCKLLWSLIQVVRRRQPLSLCSRLLVKGT